MIDENNVFFSGLSPQLGLIILVKVFGQNALIRLVDDFQLDFTGLNLGYEDNNGLMKAKVLFLAIFVIILLKLLLDTLVRDPKLLG